MLGAVMCPAQGKQVLCLMPSAIGDWCLVMQIHPLSASATVSRR